MADVLIMKAVEFDALPKKFKQAHGSVDALARAGWWVQKKYDGCFGMAVIKEGGGSQMLSRTGEDYTPSCRHILAELAGLMTECRGQGWHEAVVLGEVWHETASFPTISGKFRKNAPSDLLFAVNDLLPAGLNTNASYEDRYEDLLDFVGGASRPVFLAETWQAYVSKPTELARHWYDHGGFDGAILRDPWAGYKVGMVKAGEIVKVKPSLTLDLRCVGVTAGEGKHAGKIGALTVQYKGEYVGVGTGLSDADRAQPDDYWVGSIVEVECMSVSTEGKLREPRLKGIRIDKKEPDA